MTEAVTTLAGVGTSDESTSAVPIVRGLARGRTLLMLDDGRVTVGRSLLRALVLLLCVLPAGVGLAPALFGREHRGLHDRAAGTRVVPARTS